MSDDIRCDVCRKLGRRRMFKHCPEGWFYGESPDDNDPLDPLDNPHVVAVCSVECRDRFFVPGPGNLNTSPEYIEKAKDEGNKV